MEQLSRSSVLESGGGLPDHSFTEAYLRQVGLMELRVPIFENALAILFPGKKPGYRRDFAKIAAFLSHNRCFEMVFKKLDTDLQEAHELRIWLSHHFRVSGSLSNTFVDLFEQYGHGGFPRVSNLVMVGSSFRVFGAIVSHGLLFKDGTGPSHGEYTHTLQWLTVAKAQKMGVLRLDHTVFDIYRNSAGPGTFPSARELVRGDQPEPSAAAIWQVLVDCFPSTESHPGHLLSNLMSDSYRTPSFLMQALRGGCLRLTYIAQLLTQRYEKRRESFSTAIGMRAYHLQKQRAKGRHFNIEEGVNITVPPDAPLPFLQALSTRSVTLRRDDL
jgi:Family of unknown function (DUF5636)